MNTPLTPVAAAAIALQILIGTAFAQGAAAPTPACTDFYDHINEQWVRSTELPADRARIGSFDKLLVDPQQQNTPGLKLLAAWYGSALDPAVAKATGLRPAQPLLQRIDNLKDRAALPVLLAEFTRHRLGGPLGMFVMPDNQDVRRHILSVGGSGIGLPDRDDYLKTDDTSKRLQAGYRAYARQLLQMASAAHDDATLDALMAFETTLARSMLTAVERRNPQATNHRRTLQALKAEASGFDWSVWAPSCAGRGAIGH
jgi:putative endopeptidase